MQDKRRDQAMAMCLAREAATEDYPFGDGVAVFKVGGKMFALVLLGGEPGKLTLKCDPHLALALRDRFEAVTPGYHTNKRHWNTVLLDGSVPDDELLEMIEHSHDLVVKQLTNAKRDELGL